MSRIRVRWLPVLLLLIVVASSSCTRKIDDDNIHADPEGRNCIRINRALEIPPKYCPLVLKSKADASGVVQNYTDPATAPPASEFVACWFPDSTGTLPKEPEKFYENCPATFKGQALQNPPAGGTPIVQDMFYGGTTIGASCADAPPAPYFVPLLNEAQPTLGPVAWLQQEITGIMQDASEKMYKAIAGDPTNPSSTAPNIRNITLALVTFLIASYFISMTLQLKPLNLYYLMLMTIKIVFVLTFALNWDAFRILFNALEDQGVGSPGTISELSRLATDAGSQSAMLSGGGSNQFIPGTSTYTQIDAILATILSWNFQKFMLALLVAGWSGKLYFLLIIALILSYIRAAIAVAQVLLIALMARMFLYALAPLFIIMALLDQTKQLFHNWMEQLLSFSLQPIFLSAFLGMFLGLVTMLLGSIFNTTGTAVQLICYAEYQWIFDYFAVIHFWQFADVHGATANSDGVEWSPPVNLYVIVTIIVLSDLMRGMAQWVVGLAQTMSKGFVSAAGTFIAGAQTLGEYMKILPAGMVGGFRGAMFGNRWQHGAAWSGGMLRGQNPVSGAAQGARRAMGAQHKEALKMRRHEFGSGGANL